jgi:hypothetical protein
LISISEGLRLVLQTPVEGRLPDCEVAGSTEKTHLMEHEGAKVE